MKRTANRPSSWYSSVTSADLRKILARIKTQGAITIRDIDDDVLVEKNHPWASRKPSKRALQLAFYRGALTISEREGMLKTYELTTRHFGWEQLPKAASETQYLDYMLDRALRSQGIVSLDSVCYMDAPRKVSMRQLIERRVRSRELLKVDVENAGKVDHWIRPQTLDSKPAPPADLVHILTPFDPLVFQRKRLQFFFGYEHRFEAYVPKDRRVFGYFAQPVLIGDEIVAVIDLKADRERRRLLIQQWTWLTKRSRRLLKPRIEEALDRFERFQLAS
jgi:uncharacterized protein YcaQ